MCAAFLPNRLDAYSNASLTGLGRWWPSATDGPASRGEEMMRPRRHGEGDMVSNGVAPGPQTERSGQAQREANE
jgi:hypothetical protein